MSLFWATIGLSELPGMHFQFSFTLSASQQWHINRANHATNTDPEYIVKDLEQEMLVNQKSGT